MNNLEAFGLCSLARVVTDEVIERANHTISRSELNTLCKATTNKARTDLLSTVLLNLVEYGYLKKRFDQATNTVEFCATGLLVKGFEPPQGFLDSNGRSSGYADLLLSRAAVALTPVQAADPVKAEVKTGAPSTSPSTTSPLSTSHSTPKAANPIEHFMATTKSNTSAYKEKRERAILDFVVNSEDKRVNHIQKTLSQYFKPYVVERDLASLTRRGLLDTIYVSGVNHYDPKVDAKIHNTAPGFIAWLWDGRSPNMLRVDGITGETSWVPR